MKENVTNWNKIRKTVGKMKNWEEKIKQTWKQKEHKLKGMENWIKGYIIERTEITPKKNQKQTKTEWKEKIYN